MRTHAERPAAAGPDRPRRRGPHLRLRHAAAIGVVLGLAVLTGRDGSPLWQLARVAVLFALLAPLLRVVGRPSVAAATGAVGLVVGAAIAGPHLTKTGIGLAVVAGLEATVAGFVLLVDVARAARHRPRTSVALLVAVLLLGWSLGQAVAATNVPRTAVGDRTPADLGLAYAEVDVPSADGVVLSAWWVPPSNGAAVVLLHGAGSTRSNVLDHAGVLARRGYGVLLLDARGHGRSDGRAMDFGWWGDRDVDAALDLVGRMPGVDPGRLALVGLSMGGEEALGAAAADGRVRAVVAEGATGRTADDHAWLDDAYGLRGRLTAWFSHVTFAFADLLTSASPPITLREAVVTMAPRPVLLITAGDVADEGEVAQWLAAAAPSSVQSWDVPGTSHTDALRTHPDEWERRVVGFLDDALG